MKAKRILNTGYDHSKLVIHSAARNGTRACNNNCYCVMFFLYLESIETIVADFTGCESVFFTNIVIYSAGTFDIFFYLFL